MLIEELAPEGSLARWDPTDVSDLGQHQNSLQVGQQLRYEDDTVRLWSIQLKPGEKLPFHRHTCDYTWTCLSGGIGISRYASGDVYRITYARGDVDFYSHQNRGDFVHNLENVGETVLEFVTTEFLCPKL